MVEIKSNATQEWAYMWQSDELKCICFNSQGNKPFFHGEVLISYSALGSQRILKPFLSINRLEIRKYNIV